MSNVITINNIKKSFGTKVALDIDSYKVKEGDILGVVGNNGAGKTTLFRVMLDLLQPDTGEVCIGDVQVAKSEEWKDLIGAFIDSSFLIDYLTPEEYFYFVGKVYGLSKEEVNERLVPFARFMNNEILGQKKYIRNFSAGNKQKIGIISAMINLPKVLILDEPFNFLDPSSQSIIKHLLQKFNADYNATIIVSSHNLNHTVDISNQVVLLENGKIIRDIENHNHTAEKELESYFDVGDEYKSDDSTVASTEDSAEDGAKDDAAVEA